MAIQNLYPATRPSLDLSFAATRTLDPRVEFTRASTATFYGTQTAKAEENLLVRSQEFDDVYWGATRAVVSANSTVAPDGTTTADSLTQASGQTVSGFVQTSPNISNVAGAYVFSVFVKPNGKNFVRIVLIDIAAGNVFRGCYFNVSTGTVGTANDGAVGTITAAANGFYRCSIAYTFASAGTFNPRVFVADTDNSTTVVDSGGVFLWGAQLEQRSQVTAYTPTTTQPITRYQPVLQTAAANVARFDHDPITGESLGLLIEEQRTNLLLRSEEFENAAWSSIGGSCVTDTVVAPNGMLTGDLYRENSANSTHAPSQVVTFSAGTTLCMSVYVKQQETGSPRHVRLQMGGTNGFRAYFDLTNGTVATQAAGFGTGTAVTNSGSITPVGGSWYRCSVAGTCGPSDTTGSFILFIQDTTTGGATYQGDGYSGIYIWGAQLEVGAFPTSYIPTQASQVTRSADVAQMTGANFSSWYRQDQGTIFGEYIGVTNISGGTRRLVEIGVDGSIVDRIVAGHSSAINARFLVVASNTTQADVTPVVTQGSLVKFAGAYAVNDFQAAANATLGTADTSGSVPAVSAMFIGGDQARVANTILNGRIRRIAYYPQRLPAAQLQALTT